MSPEFGQVYATLALHAELRALRTQLANILDQLLTERRDK
jgi:hypothetical protein